MVRKELPMVRITSSGLWAMIQNWKLEINMRKQLKFQETIAIMHLGWLQADNSLWTTIFLRGTHWGVQWQEEGKICWASGKMQKQWVTIKVRSWEEVSSKASPNARFTVFWASQEITGKNPWSWPPKQQKFKVALDKERRNVGGVALLDMSQDLINSGWVAWVRVFDSWKTLWPEETSPLLYGKRAVLIFVIVFALL